MNLNPHSLITTSNKVLTRSQYIQFQRLRLDCSVVLTDLRNDSLLSSFEYNVYMTGKNEAVPCQPNVYNHEFGIRNACTQTATCSQCDIHIHHRLNCVIDKSNDVGSMIAYMYYELLSKCLW